MTFGWRLAAEQAGGRQSAQRYTKEAKDACDLSGKLHRPGMMVVPDAIIQLWQCGHSKPSASIPACRLGRRHEMLTRTD